MGEDNNSSNSWRKLAIELEKKNSKYATGFSKGWKSSKKFRKREMKEEDTLLHKLLGTQTFEKRILNQILDVAD